MPMRQRGQRAAPVKNNKKVIIGKVLAADRFKIHYLNFEDDTVNIGVTNAKFRSTAQAVGRIASTLQRLHLMT